MNRPFLLIVSAIIIFVSGCGYTTRSLLPTEFKSIHVDNFKNEIKITAEQSNERMYVGYRPGMEIELTRAVIDKFLMDGNLKIAAGPDANLLLYGTLIDFRREALRYDANDNVEEYRVKITVDIELVEAKTGKVVWTDNGFTGETTYRTGGALAKSESAGVKEAISDLARRIVERTIEAW